METHKTKKTWNIWNDDSFKNILIFISLLCALAFMMKNNLINGKITEIVMALGLLLITIELFLFIIKDQGK